MMMSSMELLESRRLLAGFYLIPNSAAAEAVFDLARNRVYVPTSGGEVLRFDLATKKQLTPWESIGGSLGGADITPDGKYLYVADRTGAAGQGLLHKITIDTGAV